MRYKLLFILFFFPVLLQAQNYYIDPAGNNGNDGSLAHPWLTLYYACSHATSAGDIIHVNPGTYIETQQIEPAPNVSIEGASQVTSIIRSNYAGSTTDHYDALILLSGGSNTAQHISNLRIDGNSLTGHQGIAVYARDNVSIYNCYIVDFDYVGITLGGAGSDNNKIYNCSIINSGGCVPAGSGSGHHPNIIFTNQTGSEIHDNIITQTARASNSNGEGIAGYEGLHGCKIYNNTITCQIRNGTTWTFALEFFSVGGATEIYGNTIIGEVDFGHDVLYFGHAYSVYFHDNIVGPSAPNNTTYNLGIQFEYTSEGVIIDKNIFKNLYSSVMFEVYITSGEYMNDITITRNIMYNCGNTGGGGYGIYFHTGENIMPQYVSNLNIWNNTIIAHPTYSAEAGVMLPTGTTVTNVSVRNNIIQGFNIAPIYLNQPVYGTFNGLSVENNLYYQNNNNAGLYLHPVPLNKTEQNNITDNPDFVSSSDFHLQTGSPAIGSGINVGLTTDFDGINYSSPPAIGAYEFPAADLDPPIVTTSEITDVEETTATGGGNVISDGGASVTARGVCWSTNHNPTTADSKTTNGTGTGVFVSSLAGLTGGLTYYVRAYATNSEGTSYGIERSFIAATSGAETTIKLLKSAGRLIKSGSRFIRQ